MINWLGVTILGEVEHIEALLFDPKEARAWCRFYSISTVILEKIVNGRIGVHSNFVTAKARRPKFQRY